MNRILIAGASDRAARFLTKGLRAEGYVPTYVRDPSAVGVAIRLERPDLVLLDTPSARAVLPLIDVLRAARLPVIVLSAAAELADTVALFEAGAVDHLTRPFRFDELLARVRARLRQEELVLRGDGILVDVRSRRALVDGRTVDLTAREYSLLALLLRNRRAVLSRAELLAEVWGRKFCSSSNVVDVCIRSLRTKIGFERIDTVRGIGYRCN